MSDDNIVDFNGVTRLDLDPNRILAKVPKTLKSVLILGYDEDGSFYFASSRADGAENVWMMECAKFELMRFVHGELEE